MDLLSNFFYIGVLKFLNIGSKYFLVGYLIRILGENGYGILTWVDSIVQYFIMLINFGFDLYAAKYVVENKKGDIFLISNNISGYKPRKRKGKSCFIYNSPSFIKYMFKRFNVELKKGNSLEFLIKKTPLKIENQICFKLIIQ